MKKILLITGLMMLALISGVSAQSSDCYFSHDYVGCDIPEVQQCVCNLDAWCCSVNWDGICVNEAINDCSNLVCGNGAIDAGEQCDDGNVQNGDGCSDSCMIEQSSDVPEFGAIAAIGIIAVGGIFLLFRRK